jgi:hypothetical protein
MNFRRSALIVIVVLASVGLADPWSRGATSQAPIGLPIFQFVNSGSGPLPWNAFSLENAINNTTMLGGPHAASSATQGVVAYRTNHGDLAMYTQHLNGPAQWTDLSRTNNVPTPAADPVPFFDPEGNVDLLYIDSGGDAILLSKNDAISPLWHHLRGDAAPIPRDRPFSAERRACIERSREHSSHRAQRHHCLPHGVERHRNSANGMGERKPRAISDEYSRRRQRNGHRTHHSNHHDDHASQWYNDDQTHEYDNDDQTHEYDNDDQAWRHDHDHDLTHWHDNHKAGRNDNNHNQSNDDYHDNSNHVPYGNSE